MHSIDINPYYIIFNVIFIHNTKHFVFLERSCWTSVHASIFGRRNSTPGQRKQLKALFYRIYKQFVYDGINVDVIGFNQSVDNIKWGQAIEDRPTPGSVRIYEEGPACVEEFIDPDKSIEDHEIKRVIVMYKQLSIRDDYREEICLFLNATVSICDDYRILVEYIGFNRCINVIRNFIFEIDLRIGSIFEKKLIELFIENGKVELRFDTNLPDDNGEVRNYDTICSDCMCVGKHLNQRHKRGGSKIIGTSTCAPFNVRWFDRNGFLDLHYGSEDIIKDHRKRDDKTKPSTLTFHEKYFTKKVFDGLFKNVVRSRITGYSHWDSFRYGDLELNRYSEQRSLVDRKLYERYYLSVAKSKFKGYDLSSKLPLMFIDSKKIDEYNLAVRNFENRLRSIELTELYSSPSLLDNDYYQLMIMYSNLRKKPVSGFGSSNSSVNTSTTDAFSMAFNQRFGIN